MQYIYSTEEHINYYISHFTSVKGNKMTEEQIIKAKENIDKMSQESMASLHRFAPSGHPYFDKTNGDLSDYFQEKFKEKGGMTSEISKSIGWR